MTKVHLVADDLTGALDSAAQFTGSIGPIPIMLRPGQPPAGSFAIDAACRDGSEAAAVIKARTTAPQLAGADIAFKKIDSLLRGHWAPELAAIAELQLFQHIILAPAFPSLGRATRNGRQQARGSDGRWRELPVDPVSELARHGIRVIRGSAGPPGSLGPAPSIMLCDAVSDDDLESVVRLGRNLSGEILWCGTAGLARALSGVTPPNLQPASGPHLVVVGSNHAVSRAQMAVVSDVNPDWLVRFDENGAAGAAQITQTLDRYQRCVAQADLPAGLTACEAAERIAAWLGVLLPRLAPVATLTVVGGETFAAVCRALSAQSLLVEGEWRPGVPVSRLIGCGWNDTLCFSKSGAFGAADWLASLLT